jgi:hypothetical protein
MTTKPPPFNMDAFIKRLDLIMEEIGLKPGKDDREFDRALGVDNQLYRWRRKIPKTVSEESIVRIMQRFGKSRRWLMVGQERYSVQEIDEEEYEPRRPSVPAATPEIVARAMAYVKENRRKLTNREFGELVRLLLKYYLKEMDLPDDQVIKHYIVLARDIEEENP